jgi:hypothetical protein
MKCVDFVLFNKQSLPYALGETQVKPLWVYEISNHHIASTIGTLNFIM